MSSEWSGAADIFTGAAIARAVEPNAGEGSGQAEKCQNCGTALVGAHCHACGQKAQVHRTLGAFGHDILHSVLHFDGKIWRTLPLLFLKPGDLTRRYVHGERAKFLSPLALFLFSVFLTFATFNWLMPKDMDTNPVVGVANVERENAADEKEIADQIATLNAEKAQTVAKGSDDIAWIDARVALHQADLKILQKANADGVRLADATAQKLNFEKTQVGTQVARLQAQIGAAKRVGQSTVKLEEELASTKNAYDVMESAASTLATGDIDSTNWNFTDLQFWGADSLNAAVKQAAKNPQLLFYKIQSNAYKYSWALIPISVPFVWLLFFWRRKFKLFDHAVFVTYSLCFMMALGTIGAIIIALSEGEGITAIAISALVFIPPIHMYKQLKYGYGLGRFGAFWRTFALTTFSLAAFTLFASMIITLGVTA